MFKLRDWPFGPDELATIKWIKSPFKDGKSGWTLPVVFESEEGKIAQVNMPWGSLVFMRFGQIYKDGVPFEVSKDGSIVIFDIRDASEGCFTKASAAKDFLPGSMPVPGSENCWQFENDRTTVFIPCIEIVRAFLAPSIIMANALLTPYGLNDIVTSAINGNQLSLQFESTVLRKIINNSFVHYLAWLTSDERALEAWNSAYRGLMPSGATEEMSHPHMFDDPREPLPRDKRLQVRFPVQGSCRLQARVL